jgi:rhodanese-related sulfurtransferase
MTQESSLPWEVDVRAVDAMRRAQEPFLLLDCREPDEHATAQIVGAELIPMSELAERIGELAERQQDRIVVHCHHGGRSLRVARWLRNQGFDRVQSMAGGIDQWSQEIDPNVPRY